MTAVLVRARAELRARLPSMLALALLLGLASGAISLLMAGARRTDSAYTRFAHQYLAADMLVYPPFNETFAKLDFDRVAKLPQVEAAARERFLGASESDLEIVAGDRNLGRTINRVKVLDGRLPRADSLDETSVSFPLAKTRHLHVGSRLLVHFGITFTKFVPVRLRVVGIEAVPGEFPPRLSTNAPGQQGGTIRISPALHDSMRQRGVFGFDFLLLRFRRGAADFRAVDDELSRLANKKPQLNSNLDAQAANVQRSIHLQAVALRLVAGMVAIIALLVLSQLIARQAAIDATEAPSLLALGMTRGQVSLSGLARSAILGVAGAFMGVAGAFVASPLMPVGTARTAEPHPGLSFDPLVLGVGAMAALIVVVGLAAWPLWRSTKRVRSAEGIAKPSLLTRSAALPSLPPPVSTGMRLALESGRGPTAVPVRSSLTSVAVAIAGLAAALTFGAGLDHLLATPHQYGWNWDAHATDVGENTRAADAFRVLDPDPAVEALALADTPPVRLRDLTFDAIALTQHKGEIEPIVTDGHAPRAADEVALGARTLRDAHLHIGSTVRMFISAIEGGGATFKVVGVVVIPPNSDTARLGSGGVISYDGVKRMVPPRFTNLPAVTDFYIRLAPGVDKKKELGRIGREIGSNYALILPRRPGDLVNFGQVQNLPLVLAGLVAVLAAATLAHTLVTSIRRRRRDLAILKMIGFVPRQVRGAVAWQATTFVAAALVVGLPVGVVLGRVTWIAFTNQLGTVADPATPSLQLLLTIPAAVLLANIIAAVPAVMAGRMKPALALRAE